MRYLVTGSTGLLGNNVVRMLLARGDGLRVLARATSDPRPLARLELEIARGDVRDANAVERAMYGVDRVVHAAHVHLGWSQLDLSRAVNVAGTANVAASARRAGARLVYVSTVDTLGFLPRGEASDEETPVRPQDDILCSYVVTKREAEQVVLGEVAQGLDATIVHPAFMIGPWDWKPSSGRMLLGVARNFGLVPPSGLSNFCDVRDVARGILAAADRSAPGRRYILSGETLTYFQAFRVFSKVTQAAEPLLTAGPWLQRVAGGCGDLWARLTGREPEINSAMTAFFSQSRNSVSTRAEQELAYRPRPLVESAEAAWEWFRQHGYA